ncbi:MAG TPA: hypothetical protein VMD51_06210, partial [Mycobacterium sp.]|nr:hypothetical protein [Mycobacterium sp.]
GEAPTGPTTGSGPDVSSDSQSVVTGPMPAEGDSAIVATPNDIAPAPYQLSEGEVAEPGFNAGGGRR